jgi:hypothetical protein
MKMLEMVSSTIVVIVVMLPKRSIFSDLRIGSWGETRGISCSTTGLSKVRLSKVWVI